MARGSATEDDLAAGIRSVGALSAVAGSEGLRRDNPFAAPPVRPKNPQPERIGAAPEPERPLPPAVPPPPRKLVEGPLRPSNDKPTSEPGRYTDRVTLPMTAEMRTRANLIAAEIQRRRSDKSVRFTPNVLIRVAIETFFEHFALDPGDYANSEEDLRRLVCTKLFEKKASSKRTTQ